MMKDQSWPYTTLVDPAIYATRTDWPKISIVTPSYNQGQFIEETILSILNQNYPNLEYIIIDGGSTDNTVEVIKKYEHRINYWISEPDNGQADAINKGLEKCTGEIFNWINSDDYLECMALYHIAINFKLGSFDALAGSVNNFDNATNKKTRIENRNLTLRNIFSVNKESPYLWHQPGVWFNLEKLRSLRLNIDLRYCFDFELTIKYLYSYPKVLYSNLVLVNFRLHDASKTVAEQDNFELEFDEVARSLLFYFKNDKHFARRINRKICTKEWHKKLLRFVSENRKTTSFLFITKNILKNPNSTITRMTIGALKNLIFR